MPDKNIYVLHIKPKQQSLYSNYTQSGFMGTIHEQNTNYIWLKCFMATIERDIFYETTIRVRKCDIEAFNLLEL